jgi:DNA-directed RNA polymerase specialized sigma24 family protein
VNSLLNEGGSIEAGKGAFPTTPWSVVLNAGRTDSPGVAHALDRLCRLYWYPLYAYLRRNGVAVHDAEDLTQGFFAHLFEKNALQSIGQEKGKFRSFLLAACTNFLRDQRDKAGALKRGGAHTFIPLDVLTAEELYAKEIACPADPQKLFERRWAYTLINAAIARLQGEYEASGNHALFEKLEPYLTREMEGNFYAREAPGLGLSEGAVRVALHRLRRRFGVLLRSEVAYTVSSEEEIEDELRQLLAAVAG